MTVPTYHLTENGRPWKTGDLQSYCLVEFDWRGEREREFFQAPDDNEALDRALDVAEGDVFELWCDRRLVRRWASSLESARSFA